MKNKICHITTVHNAKDTRIFQKECVSLANHGFDTHLIVANQKSETSKGVQIHNITSTTSGRLYRMWKTTQIALEKALKIDDEVVDSIELELKNGVYLLKLGKKIKQSTSKSCSRRNDRNGGRKRSYKQ